MPGLYPTADLQYSTAGELAAAATGRLAIWYRRQWYRRAWPAQHDWTRLTLSEVEDDRPRRKTGGFPFAHGRSELRSQHPAMAACRGLTDGLLHSITQAGRLQPGVRSTRLPTTSPRALAGHLEASGQRATSRALARGGGGGGGGALGAPRDMAPPISASHHLIIRTRIRAGLAGLEPRCSPLPSPRSHWHCQLPVTACRGQRPPAARVHHSSARAVDCQ